MNIKTINPIGTAWQGRDFECITLYFGILYAPVEHLVFYPNPSGEYGWDRATFPDWDNIFHKEKQLIKERERLWNVISH